MPTCVRPEPAGGRDRYLPMNNAFWDGSQMAYGDGDGKVFRGFTRGLDVVAHELTHGLQAFTSNLVYRGQSGVLNEHFADVFGVLVRQWRCKEPAETASWLVGAEVLVPAATRRGIRDMEQPGTADRDDPLLGTDPQPGHMKAIFTGPADSGGVHINSGIPNRAFVLAAKALGGHAWETAGGRSGTSRCCSSRGPASSRIWPGSRPRWPATGSGPAPARRSGRPGRRWACDGRRAGS